MKGIASLSEQDMARSGRFLQRACGQRDGSGHPSKAASVQSGGVVKKRCLPRATVPISSKPIDPSYPKLAGQHADYLWPQSYTVKDNHVIGRGNPIMGWHGAAVQAV